MGKLRLIRETKIVYHILKKKQKINRKKSTEKNQQIYRQLLQSKKGEIRKNKRLCEIELANNIKDSIFCNNKNKNKKIVE